MSRTPVAPIGTEALVRGLVTERFGGTIDSIEQMTFGHGSVTYRVALGDTSVIVRTNAKPSVFTGTAVNIEILRGLGMPVPVVLDADLTCERVPFAYVITDTFPGRDLRYEAGRTDRRLRTPRDHLARRSRIRVHADRCARRPQALG